jgi:hypothetical protein
MSCERCAAWADAMPIATPEGLRALLQALSAAEQTGLLHQIDAPDAPDYEERVSVRALIDEPWPDVFAAYFACSACAQRFCLACETYHGWGGSWEPVPADTATGP